MGRHRVPMLLLGVLAALFAVGWAVLALTMPPEYRPPDQWQPRQVLPAGPLPSGCATPPPGSKDQTFICLSWRPVGP